MRHFYLLAALVVAGICFGVHNIVSISRYNDTPSSDILTYIRLQQTRIDELDRKINDLVKQRYYDQPNSNNNNHVTIATGEIHQHVRTNAIDNIHILTTRIKLLEEQQERQSSEIVTLKKSMISSLAPKNLDNRASRYVVNITPNTVKSNLRQNTTSRYTEEQTKTNASPHSVRDMNGTVVTAYFEIPSKHSKDNYIEWMAYMLSINDPVIIFTTSNWVEKMKTLRRHATNRTTIVEVSLDDLPMATNFNESVWKRQFELDPIAMYRKSYRLYWIWLSKTHFVNEAIRLNPYKSSHFMWIDIGCFRFRSLTETFGNKTIMTHLERIPTESVLLMAHAQPNPPDDPWFSDTTGSSKHFYTSGSSFAATVQTATIFHTKFLETLHGYMNRGLFVGEDQILLQSTCLQNYGLCQYVKANEVQPTDTSYFALRSVLMFGGDHYHYWTPPKLPS